MNIFVVLPYGAFFFPHIGPNFECGPPHCDDGDATFVREWRNKNLGRISKQSKRLVKEKEQRRTLATLTLPQRSGDSFTTLHAHIPLVLLVMLSTVMGITISIRIRRSNARIGGARNLVQSFLDVSN
jgi:hypothetical protein